MTSLVDGPICTAGARRRLLASWEEYARGAPGAAVRRVAGRRGRGVPERARAQRLQQRAPRTRSRGRRARRRPRRDGGRVRGRPASRGSPPGCTRATQRCAPISSGAATRSTRRHARWGCHSTTSSCPAQSSSSGQRTGPSTCASSGLPRGFSAGPTSPPSISCVARLGGRMRRDRDGLRSRRRLRDLQRRRHWSMLGGADWARR